MCKGHQAHESCLKKWIQLRHRISCPVCKADLNMFIENQLEEAVIRDDLVQFKSVVAQYKFNLFSSHLIIKVRLAIRHSAQEILDYLKPSEESLNSCGELYPEFLKNINYTSVQWLLGKFHVFFEIPLRDELIQFLIKWHRIKELFRIYHFCFFMLTQDEHLLLGEYLSNYVRWFTFFGFRTPYDLFYSVSSENKEYSRYILTELLPNCLNSSYGQQKPKCQICGSIHDFKTIIGAIFWKNLYYLDFFLTCYFQTEGDISSQQFKKIAEATKRSPFKNEILEILNFFPQFSKRRSWKLTLFGLGFGRSP